MHILVTNDDGVTAPGLPALAQALRPFGSVSILAPDRNWSAFGHVKTLHRPLRIREVTLADGSSALACDGAPSDCVALVVLGVIDEKYDFSVAANIAQQIVRRVIAQPVDTELLLNVNVPACATGDIQGIRITHQGMRVYRDALDKRLDPRGRPYYWIGGEEPTGIPNNGSDFGAIAGGYVSVTPLQLDLTTYQMAQKLSARTWD